MADNPKSPLRPEGEDLLQVSISTTPNIFSHSSFLSLPRRPSPIPSPSPTFPAFLPSSPHRSFPQTQHIQSPRIQRSLPQPPRPSPPSRPRSSKPGRQSTTRRSSSGVGRARPCARVPRRNVRGGRSAGLRNSGRRSWAMTDDIRTRVSVRAVIGKLSHTGVVVRVRRLQQQQHPR